MIMYREKDMINRCLCIEKKIWLIDDYILFPSEPILKISWKNDLKTLQIIRLHFQNLNLKSPGGKKYLEGDFFHFLF